MCRMVPRAAAVYARISDDTEGMAAGVSRQVEDARALCARGGWSLAPYPPFVDNDISASTRSKARRPAFEELLSLVEAGLIDGIAYYSSSRLTRRPAEFETIIQLVERTGVQLASVASGTADLTTADGRMIARILAAQDAAEAERTGERVKRAFEQRRAQGKPNPSSRTFGFEPGGVTVVPEEAELIRQAAARVVDEGWSMGELVRDWNERGVPTMRGAEGWNGTQVRRALLSPRTAGLITQRGTVVGAGTFGSILTLAEQERVAEVLAGRRDGKHVKHRHRRNLLSGFLVCGRCGKPAKVNALLNADDTLRRDSFASCSKSNYGCGNVRRNLPMLNEYIEGLVAMRLETWRPIGEVGPDEGMTEAAGELQRELVELAEDVADLEAAFKAGSIRFKDYNAALSALRTRQEGAQAALNRLRAPEPVLLDLDPLEAWASGSLDQRRAVLATLVDHITLLPMGKVGPAKARELLPERTPVAWRT